MMCYVLLYIIIIIITIRIRFLLISLLHDICLTSCKGLSLCPKCDLHSGLCGSWFRRFRPFPIRSSSVKPVMVQLAAQNIENSA